MHRYTKAIRRAYSGIAGALSVCALTVNTAAAAAVGTQTIPAQTSPVIAQVPHVAVTDMGRAAASTRVNVSVALNYHNAADLEAFITAVADPSSPQYGHFLTPAQFAASFAPTPAEYARAAASLKQAGFTVTHVSATRTIINASAPAAVAERFFNTQFHAVKQKDIAGTRYANAAPAYLPNSLRGLAFGFAGLNNLIIAKTHNVRGTRAAAGMQHIETALGAPLQGPDTGLGPYAYASAYNYPVQRSRPGGAGKTYDGTGRAAGVVIDSDLIDSDLVSFLAYFRIARTGPGIIRVPVDGGVGVNFDGVETTLDVETIAGLAPGAAVYIYLIPDLTTASIVDGYAKVVEDSKLDAVDSSFGGCELDDNLAALSDHIAIQGAAEGITFNASTGDFGAQTCLFSTSSGLGVSSPAVAPHFVGVGGTSLLINTSASYVRELTWTGSGGGVSTIFAKPAYQTGVPGVIGATRNLPDLSLDANPGTGAAFFYDGVFQGPIGGTSLSSPLFTALITELNEISGKRSGFVNPHLYSLFKSAGYGKYYRDITLGNNSYFGPGYNAAAGYDAVTGIGSPIGASNGL